MRGQRPLTKYKQLKLFCFGCLFSVAGTTATALDCTFWGDFAGTIHGDYAARVEAGISPPDALEQTSEMLDYDYTTLGTMNHIFLSAVLAALESGSPREVANTVGRDVCLSYPAGTFDPDSGE